MPDCLTQRTEGVHGEIRVLISADMIFFLPLYHSTSSSLLVAITHLRIQCITAFY